MAPTKLNRDARPPRAGRLEPSGSRGDRVRTVSNRRARVRSSAIARSSGRRRAARDDEQPFLRAGGGQESPAASSARRYSPRPGGSQGFPRQSTREKPTRGGRAPRTRATLAASSSLFRTAFILQTARRSGRIALQLSERAVPTVARFDRRYQKLSRDVELRTSGLNY